MKKFTSKIIALGLAATLCTACLTACKTSAEETTVTTAPATEASDPTDPASQGQNGTAAGGWTVAENAEVTADHKKIVEDAASQIEGFSYEPVRLIATQVVAGTNYCFLCKSTVMAQMGLPDMKIPIGLALCYPDRLDLLPEFSGDMRTTDGSLDLFTTGSRLTFEMPDRKVFRCIDLAYAALEEGGAAPVVMNGANEELVAMFLAGKIGFLDIPDTISRVMDAADYAAPHTADIISTANGRKESSSRITRTFITVRSPLRVQRRPMFRLQPRRRRHTRRRRKSFCTRRFGRNMRISLPSNRILTFCVRKMKTFLHT